MQRPGPDQYNPPLTWRAHSWRIALAVTMSVGLGWSSAPLQWREARWLLWIDLSLGALALALSFFRRRWPLPVALATSVMGAFSITANGPGTLVKVSLATRRVMWQILLVGLLALVSSATIPMLQPAAAAEPWAIDFVLGLLSAVAMLACGMYIGSHRELLWTLRDRADRAEAEQALRVEQGRSNERAQIAREMHDVLAHRISLIAMHAGAMAFRTNLTAEQMHETAELIQDKSHEALRDLRQVLGVMRGPGDSGAGERPQPTFGDLSALVHEAERAGMRIQYDDQVHASADMPDQVGRTTYRIIQESLTNVRKHAPGVPVDVHLSGSPADGVNIRIRNPAPGARPHNGAGAPGAGLGLVGLRERATLAGGSLTARRVGASFEVTGWLPWAT